LRTFSIKAKLREEALSAEASMPSARRKRSGADEFLEKLDHFTVARDFFDRLIMEFGEERRWFIAG
jgi:hypothetical protein